MPEFYGKMDRMEDIRGVDLRLPRSKWHPAFSKFSFDRVENAIIAIQEGEALRSKINGRRILEAK